MSKKKTPKRNSGFIGIIKSLKKYYVSLIISLVLLVISVVFTILAPSYIQELTNKVLDVAKAISKGNGPQNLIEVAKPGLILVGYYIIAFVSGYISAYILNTVIQKYSRDMREDISKKINKMPLDYFDTRATGDILSVVTNDVDTLATSLQNSVTMLLESGLLVIGAIAAMFFSCVPMAVVVLFSLPLMLIVLFVSCKFALPEFDKNQKLLGEVNTITEENFTGQLIIKSFNAEEYKGKAFKEKNKQLNRTLYISQTIGGIIQPLMSFISYLTYAAVLIVGGWLVVKGYITFGVITAFLVYVGLFQEPLAQIGQASNTLQLASAAAGRVFGFLDSEEMPDESKKKNLLDHNKIKGEVEFKKVYFGYTKERMFVKNFSAKIKPGMKVAVVGPTGAGKTTLVNLLMRFYEITKGDILIDGVSIKDMSRRELHEIFGMILQETWVMNGSLRENVVYNIKKVDSKRLKTILDDTNLSHFVSTLPKGLDEEIKGESALSQGQRQLVTIARAMVENAPMMILDEATSNVDTRTEILIADAMDALTKGRTSFVIAHRLSTIKNADLILVMKDGNIVETGDHDSLMKKGGLYSEIYNAQFQK